jgi:hypothetical protein
MHVVGKWGTTLHAFSKKPILLDILESRLCVCVRVCLHMLGTYYEGSRVSQERSVGL